MYRHYADVLLVATCLVSYCSGSEGYEVNLRGRAEVARCEPAFSEGAIV